jgi:hypothetical protein
MILLSLSLSLSAIAQSDSPEPVIIIPEVQELTEDEFNELDIDGILVRPSVSAFNERRQARFDSWIELRQDFRLEVRESLGNLK